MMDEPFGGDREELLRILLREQGFDRSGEARIEARPAGEPAPLSFGQLRLWFMHQLDPASPAYVSPFALRLAGQLDVAALERALGEVVRRHEVLRTTVDAAAGEPVQRVARPLPVRLEPADLGSLPAAARAERLRALAAAETHRPFDLARGPVFRARLLRLGPAEHVLLLVVHHIAWDGWSAGILVRELGVLYAALHEGRGAPLPELPVQYADYAAWQRRRLQGPALDAQLAYWRRQLAGLTALALPADHQRPPVPSGRAAKHRFALGDRLAADVAAMAHEAGVTPFAVLLAGFQALLASWTGQTDVAVVSPTAGRTRSEVEPLIGFFVNALVLRTDLAGDPTVRELLERTRAVCVGAHANQDVPFERLVEDLNPVRDLSRTPLAQVAFAFQNAPMPMPAPADGGLELRPLDLDPGATRFDLALHLWEESWSGRNDLAGWLVYSPDLFDAPTAGRLAAHYRALLACIVAAPDRRLSELRFLPEPDLAALEAWNATERPYPPACLHDLVEARAARAPDAVAVVAGDRSLTYRELVTRAGGLAGRLRALGVGPDVPVGVCVERSPELVVGLLAVLVAGGAYVPLDPDLPSGRLAAMVEDCGAPIVLADAATTERLAGAPARLVDVGRPDETGPSGPRPAVGPDNLAYVIYTSGSTGAPKGVMVTHRGLCNRLRAVRDLLELDETDGVLHKTAPTFDVATGEIFLPLVTGARLVLAPPGGHRDPDALAAAVAEQRVTYLHFVPSMLREFLDRDVGACSRSLRHLWCGGEVLAPDLRDRCLDRLRATLHQGYGPTEATIGVTHLACGRDPGAALVPLGRPVANVRVHVLDRWLRPVPPGVAGELCIGGAQLARGYLHQPALTAERFVPDPLAVEAGARMYRTGDLGRRREDGVIEFIGRRDRQVKLRGVRVQLEEIEAALDRHPSVRRSAVAVRPLPDGEARLVAWVATGAAPDPGVTGLREFLLARLPGHMVPDTFTILPELPLTPAGKVDLRALPDPGADRPALAAEYVEPRTATEVALAAIWRELLGLTAVGTRDSFFEVGGHSVLVLRLRGRIERVLGRTVPVARLFQSPTIGSLAAHLDGESGGTDPPAERARKQRAAMEHMRREGGARRHGRR